MGLDNIRSDKIRFVDIHDRQSQQASRIHRRDLIRVSQLARREERYNTQREESDPFIAKNLAKNALVDLEGFLRSYGKIEDLPENFIQVKPSELARESLAQDTESEKPIERLDLEKIKKDLERVDYDNLLGLKDLGERRMNRSDECIDRCKTTKKAALTLLNHGHEYHGGIANAGKHYNASEYGILASAATVADYEDFRRNNMKKTKNTVPIDLKNQIEELIAPMTLETLREKYLPQVLKPQN